MRLLVPLLEYFVHQYDLSGITALQQKAMSLIPNPVLERSVLSKIGPACGRVLLCIMGAFRTGRTEYRITH